MSMGVIRVNQERHGYLNTMKLDSSGPVGSVEIIIAKPGKSSVFYNNFWDIKPTKMDGSVVESL